MANNEDVKNAANQAGKNAKSLSAGMQYAIVTCLPNIGNGAFWGFASLNEVKKHSDVIKAEESLVARKVGNGCVIEVNPNYIMTAAVTALPGAITQTDINNMKKAMGEAEAEFIKFLIKKGKAGNFEGKVGIYCINDVTTIQSKGVSYPAFRLPIGKVLELCNTFGYKFKVNGQFVTPKEAMNSGNALFESMELSPTKTGVFCEIQSTYSKEKISELEQQFIKKPTRSNKK